MARGTGIRTVTFNQPFVLSSLEGVQPLGSYRVETEERWMDMSDEELLDIVSTSIYRQIVTSIHLPARPGRPGIAQKIRIDPEELKVALRRDATSLKPSSISPSAPFARRQARRAQKASTLAQRGKTGGV